MSELIEEEEIWAIYKDTRGKHGRGSLWELSTYGNIKKSGKEYSPYDDGRYLKFGCGYVHKAVAELFIDNPENLPEIDHIDRNKHNNHVSNLRWCSRKENMANIDKEAWRKQLSTSHKGKKKGPLSEETRKQISASCKGKKKGPRTEETKQKISASEKGKFVSNETRKKISNSLIGRHHSEESKQKMAEKRREYWQKRKREK